MMDFSAQPNGFHESAFLSCVRQLVAEHDRLQHDKAELHQKLLEFQGTEGVGPQTTAFTRMDLGTSSNEAAASKCSVDKDAAQCAIPASRQTRNMYPLLTEGAPHVSELPRSISDVSMHPWSRAAVRAELIGVEFTAGADQEEVIGTNDVTPEIGIFEVQSQDPSESSSPSKMTVSKFHDCQKRISENMSQRRQTRSQIIKLAVWRFIDQPDGGLANQLFHTFYNMLIALSVLSPIIASTPISQAAKTDLRVADLIFTIMFTMEILIKLACCPNRRVFMESMYTVIDFAVVIAGYINVAFSEPENIMLQLVASQVPILRLLKITRHSTGWHLLVISMKNCIAPLLVPLYLLLLMVVFSGSLHYWMDLNFGCVDSDCEEIDRPAFRSIPHAMWFVIVTLASVGYGDVVPHTDLGKVLASIQIVGGVCFIAMPLSIIGRNFTKVWDDRHRLIMRRKLISRSNGMDMDEMKHMFYELDGDGSEAITFEEFAPFVESLQLGVSKRALHDLFKAIDIDGSRSISFAEFEDFLFPGEEAKNHFSKTKAFAGKVVKRMATGTSMLSQMSSRSDRAPVGSDCAPVGPSRSSSRAG
ncbi:unnamed protein product [Polarella glacialis]|uniref:EF-hand domain-containing protein n=1 Tax=Polarella glacialis TaxID=89957 RepID=A0A813FG29_POLGL|nr:unnamed protein product [Polarella glacialis]CAE8660189.1 unnamed protein product [Polarella glacialis]